MEKKLRIRLVAVVCCLALVAVVLPAASLMAAMPAWTRIATEGIDDPDCWATLPGEPFEGILPVGGFASESAALHAWDGESFSRIGEGGFGNINNRAIRATTVYNSNLFIGTLNSDTGCEVWAWDSDADPVKLIENGFGVGPDNAAAIPMGVVDTRLIVAVNNNVQGIHFYSFDGTDWEVLVGPGGAEPAGFGDPKNTSTAFAGPHVIQGRLVMTVNNVDGLRVYTFDGTDWEVLGEPGEDTWNALQVHGFISASELQDTVYLGTGIALGAPGELEGAANGGAQLWAYSNDGWTMLGTGGLGNPSNSSLVPLARGSQLLIGATNHDDGCMVYRWLGEAFDEMCEPGFGAGSDNFMVNLTSFDSRLIALTGNAGGSQIFSTPIAPSIDLLEPNSGAIGMPVTIHGHDFGLEQGDEDRVSFGGIEAEVHSWDDNRIVTMVPPGAATGPVQVHTARGDSNQVIFTITLPNTWYFAEGTTRDNANDGKFEEWISIQNPNDSDEEVTINYLLSDGTTVLKKLTVPATSRSTVDVNAHLGSNKDASAIVSGNQPLLVERPMYFNYKNKWTGGHVVMGLPQPREEFYFAEGTTRGNNIDGYFEQWICVMNPNETEAEVTVNYLLEGEASIKKTYTVKEMSRHTIDVNRDVGRDKDVSTVVSSDIPIVAERPMYFNYHNKWTGGHNVVGAPGPDVEFFFAEGTTRNNPADGAFEQWISLQNSSDSKAEVTITYLTDRSGSKTQKVSVPAKSRKTVDVNLELGPDVDTSFHIQSSVPILVERPMYFNYKNNWAGGHNVMGCSHPSNNFYFAEGTTLSEFATWMAIMNPGETEAEVVFNYMLGDGTNVQKIVTLEPLKRYTRNVADDVGLNKDVSTLISSDIPIVAERPMYFGYKGWCPGGHNTLGFGL